LQAFGVDVSPESLSPESDLRTWLRDQPRSWLRLPWTTPREARATLSRDAAARLAPFEACLRDSWRADQPHRAAAMAFALLDPASRIAFYPGAPAGGSLWFMQSITSGVPGTERLRHHEILPEVSLYDMGGQDPFANSYVARSMKRLGCRSRRELMLGASHGRS